MIIYEQLENNMVKAYSDKGMMIHGGFPEADYAEAIDPANLNRTYTETDTPIPSEEISDSEALNIIMGRGIHGPDDSEAVPHED